MKGRIFLVKLKLSFGYINVTGGKLMTVNLTNTSFTHTQPNRKAHNINDGLIPDRMRIIGYSTPKLNKGAARCNTLLLYIKLFGTISLPNPTR